MSIDYKRADKILKDAWADGRRFLLEPEAYTFLRAFGIKASDKIYIKTGEEIPSDLSDILVTKKLVLKVVSPLILHKTDVGGVKFPGNDRKALEAAIDEMYAKVPANFVKWVSDKPELMPESLKGMSNSDVEKKIADSIKGVLVSGFVEYKSGFFGYEVLVGLQNSREFGPVITYGAGGIDTEFWAELFKERKAVTTYSAELLDSETIGKMIKVPAVYDKLAGKTREKKKLVDDSELISVIEAFQAIGKRYTPSNPDTEFAVEELEVNPFAACDGSMMAIDALCRFSKVTREELPDKPLERIHNLLKPESIAIIGVSEKMNIGHIILNNILKNGFDPKKLYIIKEGADEIDSIKCYPSLADLPEKVDLFIYTLPAPMLPPVVKEIVDGELAKAVIVISGGLGETKGGKKYEDEVLEIIRTARKDGKPTPVFNGGNCMGLRSLPGKYDTLFIPEYKLDLQPEGGIQNTAYLSQSGAFMICRLSKLKSINPVYSVTTGNQMDLAITDYLEVLADDENIKVYGVYIEGFDDLDGLRFARAAKKIIKSGRYVILYKAGRSSAGKTAASGHTSSIAGDYSVCKGVLEKIGVIMPHNFDEFEDIVKFLSFTYDKKINGDRIGLVSNAGFEAVGMADNLEGDNSTLNLGDFSKATSEKIRQALAINKIDQLIEVHNPLDITPMASDEIYDLCLRAILEEKDVDFGLISIVPMTWAIQSLPKGDGHNEDLNDKGSIVQRLIKTKAEYDKPFVAVVDCGKEYDPMVEMLEEAGIPTFRTADRAVRIIRKFAYHKIHKKSAW